MSSYNCCFLTCIQVSQEAGQVVWYSHLFRNFPQLIVIHTVKGFGIVNKAEIDVFLQLSCFFHDPADVGNLMMFLTCFKVCQSVLFSPYCFNILFNRIIISLYLFFVQINLSYNEKSESFSRSVIFRLFATPWTVHGILQARLLERAAIPFSRESSQTRDQT